MAVIEKNLPSMDVAVAFTSSTAIIPYYYYYGLLLILESRTAAAYTPPANRAHLSPTFSITHTDYNYGVLTTY